MKWLLILTAYVSTTISSILPGAAGQWIGSSPTSWGPSWLQPGGGRSYDINQFYDKKKSSSASDESFYNSAKYNQLPSYYWNNLGGGGNNWGWPGNQIPVNPPNIGGGAASWGWPGSQISVNPPSGGGANWGWPGTQVSVGPPNMGGGGANWWYPDNQISVGPPSGGYLTQYDAQSGCGNCWFPGGNNLDQCAGCRYPNYPPVVPNYITGFPPREDVSWLALDKNNNNRQNILLESGRKTLP